MLLALDSVPGSDVSDRHRYDHGTPPRNDEIRRRVLERETEVAKLKELVQQLLDTRSRNGLQPHRSPQVMPPLFRGRKPQPAWMQLQPHGHGKKCSTMEVDNTT